jgi:hypothetical protein
VTGVDFCPACEQPTLHALVGRRADPDEAARVFGVSPDECGNVASVGWTCSSCGGLTPGTVERVLVHLAALGLDPQPATT